MALSFSSLSLSSLLDHLQETIDEEKWPGEAKEFFANE